MGATNFCVFNAPKHHVLSTEDLTCQEVHMLAESIDDYLSEHGFDKDHNNSDWNELRSYPSLMLDSYLSKEVQLNDDYSVTIELFPLIRFGYYADAVVDFNYKFTTSEYSNVSDSGIRYFAREGLSMRHQLEDLMGFDDVDSKDAQEWATKLIDEYQSLVEKFENAITNMDVVRDFRCVAVFGNGEATHEPYTTEHNPNSILKTQD